MSFDERVDADRTFTFRELRGLILMIAIFLGGIWFTWEEIRFCTSGVTTTATIVEDEVVPETTRIGRNHYQDNRIRIYYQFADTAGQTHLGEVVVYPEHIKTLSDADGKMDIIYLRGSPETSMPILMRHTSYAIGFCSFLGVALLIYLVYFFKIRPGILEERRRDAMR